MSSEVQQYVCERKLLIFFAYLAKLKCINERIQVLNSDMLPGPHGFKISLVLECLIKSCYMRVLSKLSKLEIF